MIKYGLGGLPLRGQQEEEIILTSHGLIRRKKEPDKKDDTAVKLAERLASGRNTKIDNELLAKCLGKPVKEVMTGEEKIFQQIAEEGGLKRL